MLANRQFGKDVIGSKATPPRPLGKSGDTYTHKAQNERGRW